MGDYKALANREAIEKIRALAKNADICMFTTALTQLPLASRPMSTQEVDEDGRMWFFSKATSEISDEIKEDGRVQLFYCNKGAAEYLSVYGTVSIIRDEARAKELWSPILKTWFPDGVDDPELRIIIVQPEEAYYWDTKHNKMISLIKMLAGSITGKEMDDSIEGKIQL